MKICYYVIEGNCLPNNYVLIVSSNLGLNNTFFFIYPMYREVYYLRMYIWRKLYVVLCTYPWRAAYAISVKFPLANIVYWTKILQLKTELPYISRLVTSRCFYLINEPILWTPLFLIYLPTGGQFPLLEHVFMETTMAFRLVRGFQLTMYC